MSRCLFDAGVHPRPLNIAAGLDEFGRQIATYPEYRRAMLAAIRLQPPLATWGIADDDDLGLMLVEMWAYVCDALSFYDEVIAHELYLRTARLRPSMRKLAGLVDYVPRPAIAAMADLALLADGRKPITVPAGTGFRSGGFGDEPPQVFELLETTVVDPLNSKWSLEAPRPDRLPSDLGSSLLLERSTTLKEGDIALIKVADDPDEEGDEPQTIVAAVASVEEILGTDGDVYAEVTFTPDLKLGGVKSALIKILKPSRTFGLWKLDRDDANGANGDEAIEANKITLDGLHREVNAGDHVVLELGETRHWFSVKSISETERKIRDGATYVVGDVGVRGPAILALTTQLIFDADVVSSGGSVSKTDWSDSNKDQIVVHHGFNDAGRVVVEAKTWVGPDDTLGIEGPVETRPDSSPPHTMLLEDLNETGRYVEDALSFEKREIKHTLLDNLTLPVKVFGNVVKVSRGETVTGEVLGSGEASLAYQSFQLKKGPLTYVPSPGAANDFGAESTLKVRVDGILWEEVHSFYGKGGADLIYVVRHDDEQGASVTFGDGIRGSRLPSGADNVTCSYRYGAGAVRPPAQSIAGLAKPVDRIVEVRDPVGAYGGGDAETREELKSSVPRQAIVMGRAVSMPDIEAVAAGVAGVRAVDIRWQWHAVRQRPVVHMWIVGTPGLERTVTEQVLGISDPSLPLEVELATPIAGELEIDVSVDAAFLPDVVEAGVSDALLDPVSGVLLPEAIGIGARLDRSRIFEAALSVDGAVAVRGLRLSRDFPPSLGADEELMMTLPEGHYFDIDSDRLTINGVLLNGE